MLNTDNDSKTSKETETKRKAETAWACIDERAGEFYAVSDALWEMPETSFQEFKSAKLLCDFLEKEGFQVRTGLAGIPTAFSAGFGSGRPVVCLLYTSDAADEL